MNGYEAFLIFLAATVVLCFAAFCIHWLASTFPRFEAWLEKWLPESDS